jgi:hypothetical protein
MRLTKYDRSRIRASIIADVPLIDYEGQMQARVTEICLAMLPPEIRRLLKDPKLRQYVRSGTVWHCCCTMTTPGFGRYDDEVSAALKTDEAFAELQQPDPPEVPFRGRTRGGGLMRTFTAYLYYRAGNEIVGSRDGTEIDLDLETACGFQNAHVRMAVAAARRGDRDAADFHHARVREIAFAIREQSEWRRACEVVGDAGRRAA